MKKHNFSAGPCILPQEVLKQASESVLNFNNDNLSLIEISHRSKPFVDVMENAKRLVRELLSVPKNYSILFLQGGASLEFLMAPYNLLSINGKCGYINTGAWSEKAIKEAKNLGETLIIGDSSDKNFNYIPKDIIINEANLIEADVLAINCVVKFKSFELSKYSQLGLTKIESKQLILLGT